MEKEVSLIKSKFAVALLVISALSLAIVPVLADTIRITPNGSYWGSIMLESPATFYANVTSNDDAGTHDVHLLMVITETCYESLTDPVTVSWNAGSNTLGSWTAGSVTVTWNGPESTNSLKLPPQAVGGYTVASLKDHLDTEEPIYWAFVPILDGAMLTTDPGIPFTVTLPADEPKMGLWLIGKNPSSDAFDNQTPTTRPGFVIPEVPTILLAAASFAAMGSYLLIKKRRQTSII
jgi:hypothetical protein